MLYQLSYEAHTLGARSIYWVLIFPCSEIMWNIYEIIHICTAVVEHRTGIAEVMGSNPVEALFFFFQASSFQLLKLENLLRWSHFTFIYYRSTNMNYFIYISHDFTAREDKNSINWPCSQCVGFIAQLVEHRTGIAEVMGSNPVEALIFFRLLLSNCLNWKIYCDDHTSLSSTTAVQIWIISYIFHTKPTVTNVTFFSAGSYQLQVTSGALDLWQERERASSDKGYYPSVQFLFFSFKDRKLP